MSERSGSLRGAIEEHPIAIASAELGAGDRELQVALRNATGYERDNNRRVAREYVSARIRGTAWKNDPSVKRAKPPTKQAPRLVLTHGECPDANYRLSSVGVLSRSVGRISDTSVVIIYLPYAYLPYVYMCIWIYTHVRVFRLSWRQRRSPTATCK